ncbi:MAG: DUF1566 domain-containing protein [Halieaceae bacterium]
MRCLLAFVLAFNAASIAMAAKTVDVLVIPEGNYPYRVVSTPPGIDCPGVCTAKFKGSGEVVLEGEALFPLDNFFFFLAWSGSCVDSSPTCTLRGNGQFGVTTEIPSLPLQSVFSTVLDPENPRWPLPRYSDPGLVEPGFPSVYIWDYLTGLRWMRDANCLRGQYPNLGVGNIDGDVAWQDAQLFVAELNMGAYSACTTANDPCLSNSGEWAIPTKNQLETLLDERFAFPMISNREGDAATSSGDPFINNVGQKYWTSTPQVTQNGLPSGAMWVIDTGNGGVSSLITDTSNLASVWPVCVNSTAE